MRFPYDAVTVISCTIVCAKSAYPVSLLPGGKPSNFEASAAHGDVILEKDRAHQRPVKAAISQRFVVADMFRRDMNKILRHTLLSVGLSAIDPASREIDVLTERRVIAGPPRRGRVASGRRISASARARAISPGRFGVTKCPHLSDSATQFFFPLSNATSQ